MTELSPDQIIEKAIQKAIDGGWPISSDRYSGEMNVDNILDWYESNYNNFIWSHDFAKALWGDKPEVFSENFPKSLNKFKPNWQVPKWVIHLQQMVVAEDPIKYLGENI